MIYMPLSIQFHSPAQGILIKVALKNEL